MKKAGLGWLILTFFFSLSAQSQVIFSGKVFDSSTRLPLKDVNILVQNSTLGTTTDHTGYYQLIVKPGDRMLIKLLGYHEREMAIPGDQAYFTEYIYLSIKEKVLDEVTVDGKKNHRKDSLANRKENADIFNYTQPTLGNSLMNAFVKPFTGKDYHHKSSHPNALGRYQERLIDEEQQKYIDARFTTSVVEDITGFHGLTLRQFMVKFRPSYAFVRQSTDYTLYERIKANAIQYRRKLEGYAGY